MTSMFISLLSMEKKQFFFFLFSQALTKTFGPQQVEKVLARDKTQKSNELMETEVKSSHCEVLLTLPQPCPLSFIF